MAERDAGAHATTKPCASDAMAENPDIEPAPPPPPPPDFATQKRMIRQLAEKPLQKNDTWCLIDTRWFKQWKKYVGYDEHDNSQVSRLVPHRYQMV